MGTKEVQNWQAATKMSNQMSTTSALRRLQGIFAGHQQIAAINQPITTCSKPTNRSAQAIVDSFKKSSECPQFRRNRFHYETAVRQLTEAKHFSGIIDIIEHQKNYPDIRNESFVVRFILLCGKVKMDHRAQKYHKIGDLFRELPSKLSIEPDLVSYNTAIKAMCKAGWLDSAVSLMDEIESPGIKPNIVTCNTLLNAFYENRRFSDADNLWDMMEKKNIIPNLCSCNIKLISLVIANEVSKANQFFDEIVNKGFKPDAFSYNTMIKMGITQGNLEEVKMWYEKMLQNDCLPDLKPFTMLVTFACSSKDFDFALRLCKKAMKSHKAICNRIMQRVVDGLVEHSKIENAKELVKLAESCGSFRYKLSLPSHN
ncbi:hypothetical protein FXO37_06590 [Capsicum annuum]|nr:hypothetical protein FXO37_06590 [Capsicum annuum]